MRHACPRSVSSVLSVVKRSSIALTLSSVPALVTAQQAPRHADARHRRTQMVATMFADQRSIGTATFTAEGGYKPPPEFTWPAELVLTDVPGSPGPLGSANETPPRGRRTDESRVRYQSLAAALDAAFAQPGRQPAAPAP